jgi:hypothetical protein
MDEGQRLILKREGEAPSCLTVGRPTFSRSTPLDVGRKMQLRPSEQSERTSPWSKATWRAHTVSDEGEVFDSFVAEEWSVKPH